MEQVENSSNDPHIVCIVGPPASGKLTVAEHIEKETDFIIFHNHMTVDIALQLYEFGTDEFFDYSDSMRLEFFERARKQGKHIIFTFCYAFRKGSKFIKKVSKINENIVIAQLVPSKEELLKRVTNESRKKHGKVSSPKKLKTIMEKYDFFKPVDEEGALRIDNTNLSAEEVAHQIMDHFNLRKSS